MEYHIRLAYLGLIIGTTIVLCTSIALEDVCAYGEDVLCSSKSYFVLYVISIRSRVFFALSALVSALLMNFFCGHVYFEAFLLNVYMYQWMSLFASNVQELFIWALISSVFAIFLRIGVPKLIRDAQRESAYPVDEDTKTKQE